MTNGEDVVITAYKKPISTLRRGLPSVDLDTLEPHRSQYERSDVTALPAAGVIAEAMVALVLADAALEKLGGDSMAEVKAHFEATLAQQRAWPRAEARHPEPWRYASAGLARALAGQRSGPTLGSIADRRIASALVCAKCYRLPADQRHPGDDHRHRHQLPPGHRLAKERPAPDDRHERAQPPLHRLDEADPGLGDRQQDQHQGSGADEDEPAVSSHR